MAGIKNHLHRPVLNGLVLAGGKSIRMGVDKSLMDLHGKAQMYYCADLLKDFCNNVFISCRQDQLSSINSKYKTIPDNYKDLGPCGAILTAFEHDAIVPGLYWHVIFPYWMQKQFPVS